SESTTENPQCPLTFFVRSLHQVLGAECSRGVLASGLYPNTCPCIDGLECKPTNEFYYKGLAIPTDYKCVN
ncbi:unnamed protein product, partial [Larinioides sclopetarius]